MRQNARIIEAEVAASVFLRLAADYRAKPGAFSQSLGARLAVQAADFRAEALRQATGQSLSSNGGA